MKYKNNINIELPEYFDHPNPLTPAIIGFLHNDDYIIELSCSNKFWEDGIFDLNRKIARTVGRKKNNEALHAMSEAFAILSIGLMGIANGVDCTVWDRNNNELSDESGFCSDKSELFSKIKKLGFDISELDFNKFRNSFIN